MTDLNVFENHETVAEHTVFDNQDTCVQNKYIKPMEEILEITNHNKNSLKTKATSKKILNPEFSVASNHDIFNQFHSSSSKLNCDFGITNPNLVQSSFTYQNIGDLNNTVTADKLLNETSVNSCGSVSKCTVNKESSLSNKIKNTKFSSLSQFLGKTHDEISNKCSEPICTNIPTGNTMQSHHNAEQDVFSSPETNADPQNKQIKIRLKSMWNNVKYGWRMKRETSLKPDSAIWLLGQCYHSKTDGDSAPIRDIAVQFRQDLVSKIWLTYRINFPVIPNTNLVSDSGWGCMLRCGQMMMAQAFVCHFLQREWRLYDQMTASDPCYKMILRWFGDSLSVKSPFSLHHLVLLGENYGRKAGDWYGPTHVAHVLRDALIETSKNDPALQSMCMYVASDGIVFKQDVFELFDDSKVPEKIDSFTSFGSDFTKRPLSDGQSASCQEALKENPFINVKNSFLNEELKSDEDACPSYSEFGPPSYNTAEKNYKSLILFVSVRLGNDKINPFYIPCLKSLLAYENCIGIIGGRPKHALYFIGFQDDKLIHMDPHLCQPAIDVEKENFCHKSFHSMSIRTIPFIEMDPSCAIGFYFKSLQHFETFIEKFSEITAPLKRNLEYPVFALAEGKRMNIVDISDCSNDKYTYTLRTSSCDDEEDGYILL